MGESHPPEHAMSAPSLHGLPNGVTLPPQTSTLDEPKKSTSPPVQEPPQLAVESESAVDDETLSVPPAHPSTPEPGPRSSSAPEKGADGTQADERPKPGSLHYAEHDLYRFLASLPIPLHRVLPRALVRAAARVLFLHKLLATDIAYDVLLMFWRGVTNLFFREIQPRSGYRIPRSGPLIFVAAPHHNQFLDPLLLASEVRSSSKRRVSFLIAQKSLDRQFIGTIARLFQSIPVRRAADSAKPGKGYLIHGDDATHVRGIGTAFTQQLEVHGHLVLEKDTGYAMAEVVEILSDTEVRIKKEFAGENVNKALNGRLHAQAMPGARYKCQPYVDQKEMYASVYECLSDGKCLGIFPEGGSHDRTDLLPLKAGVVIMALGAMANDPSLDVKIVPVGMSYFHPHKFRSRAVVEFGKPLSVPLDQVALFQQGGHEKRRAVSQMLDLVYDGLKSVTVRAPDYETLMVIQAGRRLIKMPGQQMSLGDTVELNRRLIVAYLNNKDHPPVVALRKAVLSYNEHLKQLGLRDHHVDRANRSWLRSFALLVYRLVLVLFWSGCALPGSVLNAPIILLAKVVSKRKAKEALAASQVKLYGRDVLATWKILVSLGVTPVLYLAYTVLATLYVRRRTNWKPVHKRFVPLYTMLALPTISISTLKFAEVGLAVYKSLPPLFSSLLPGQRRVIAQLQEERADLATRMRALIEELGPKEGGEEELLSHMPAARAPPVHEEEMQWRMRKAPLHGALSHPLNFLDELLFGWGHVSHRTANGADDTLDVDAVGPDYEAALSVYRRKQDDAQAEITPSSRSGRRRSSHEYRMRHPSASPRREKTEFTPIR